jgi:bifunctional ADP-heptose synthase (sugar kinase/adenylyltransferase)
MTYIIGQTNKAVPGRDQLLHDDKIQSYEVVGESAHFMKRGKPLVKIGVYCGRFSYLSAKDAVFLGLCRSNCDLLIVLVDSDYAVRLKRETEGVPHKERTFLVASLPVVDWVCSYDDTTPDVALNIIDPDYIFCGLNARDDIGINIKRDRLKRVEHPFDMDPTPGPTLSGKFFSV